MRVRAVESEALRAVRRGKLGWHNVSANYVDYSIPVKSISGLSVYDTDEETGEIDIKDKKYVADALKGKKAAVDNANKNKASGSEVPYEEERRAAEASADMRNKTSDKPKNKAENKSVTIHSPIKPTNAS